MPPRTEAKTTPQQIAELYEENRRLHTLISNLTGAAPSGERGAPGAPGADGTNGANGANGATGPPGPAATVEAFDEGVALGTFDTIDFVGAAITAALVGTDLTVVVSSTAASVLEDPRWRMMVAV